MKLLLPVYSSTLFLTKLMFYLFDMYEYFIKFELLYAQLICYKVPSTPTPILTLRSFNPDP